jgi:hypothetical protein
MVVVRHTRPSPPSHDYKKKKVLSLVVVHRAIMSPLLIFVAVLVFGLVLAQPFLRLLLRQARSPLRYLNGPPAPSFFFGNLIEMHDMENTNLLRDWEQVYGNTFRYKGFVGGCRLMTTDPVAVAHILGHAYDYPKPDFVRDSLATMAAGHNGLLTSEGDMHKRQRKILSPAFSLSHVRSLAPIFWQKAEQLRDIWLNIANSSAPPSSPSSPSSFSFQNNHPFSKNTSVGRIDALSWLGRATLDVIGEAGFGYSFNSLTSDSDALANAFAVIFSTARKFRVMTILQVWFPILRKFASFFSPINILSFTHFILL